MNEPGSGEFRIDWEHFLQVLLRRRWFLILPALAGAFAIGLYSLTIPDLYQARSTILVEPQSIPTDFMKSTLPYGPETYVRTLVEQIKSLSRLEKVIQKYGLFREMRGTRPIEDLVNIMRERIQIERRGSDTFSVAFTGEDPITVQQVTNELTDLFIEENLNFRLARSAQNVAFMEGEAKKLRQQVLDQERAIQTFKTGNMYKLPDQREATQTQLNSAQQRLQTSSERLNAARIRLLTVAERIDVLSREAAETMPGPAGEATRDSLASQIDKARAELIELQARLSERHPDVRIKQKEIAALESRLAARGPVTPATVQVRRGRSPDLQRAFEEQRLIQAEIEALEADQIKLQGEIAEYSRRLDDTPEVELALSELTRGLEVLRDQADSFQKKSTDAAASLALERSNQGSQFRALDRARVPAKPVSPNRPMLILMGAAVGLALGLGVVIGLDLLFRPFLDEHDLASFTGVPVLVSMPLVGVFPSEWQRFKHELRSLLAMLTGRLGELAFDPEAPAGQSARTEHDRLDDEEIEPFASLEIPAGVMPGERPEVRVKPRGFTYLTGDPVAPPGMERMREAATASRRAPPGAVRMAMPSDLEPPSSGPVMRVKTQLGAIDPEGREVGGATMGIPVRLERRSRPEGPVEREGGPRLAAPGAMSGATVSGPGPVPSIRTSGPGLNVARVASPSIQSPLEGDAGVSRPSIDRVPETARGRTPAGPGIRVTDPAVKAVLEAFYQGESQTPRPKEPAARPDPAEAMRRASGRPSLLRPVPTRPKTPPAGERTLQLGGNWGSPTRYLIPSSSPWSAAGPDEAIKELCRRPPWAAHRDR